MPGFDSMGMRGMGPGAGRGRGPCGRGLRRQRGRRLFSGAPRGRGSIIGPWGRPQWGYGPWWGGIFRPERQDAVPAFRNKAPALKK